MLRRLSVENYALIDSLTLELDPHLNIITGETGAGKSILLGALSLLTLDGSEAEELAWEASPFVLEQPASRPHSRAALTRSERMCF